MIKIISLFFTSSLCLTLLACFWSCSDFEKVQSKQSQIKDFLSIASEPLTEEFGLKVVLLKPSDRFETKIKSDEVGYEVYKVHLIEKEIEVSY